MQQGVQTDATCNIQQCCARLHGAWRYSQDFPWKWQVHSFVSNNEISPQSIMHIKRSKQQQTKKTNFEKLCWKTTIIIRFNVHPCLFCQRFAVFSYLILVFRSFFLCFTHFGGGSLSLSCQSSCKQVFNLVFGTLAKSSIHNEASKEAFSSLIPAWLKRFVYIVEANNHLTLASLYINFCHAYVETFCHDTRIKCGISTRN